MVRLIDDLLDVSRITSGKIELRRETVDLPATVQHAVDTLRRDVEAKNQTLSLQRPAGTLYVDADPVRIAQVVTNLVNNASKYSDEEAHITVSVGREAEEALICVRDNGIGIPPDKLDAIFDSFVQIDPSAERSEGGLGLGLTLVKSLVELHGGSVTAESDGVGRGSDFTVRLPLLPERRGRSAPEQPHAEAEPRRVLIIDDNTDSADSLSALLRMLGHEVTTLYNGEDAVREVARFAPDVILCDIRMPGTSGLDVAKQLRRVFKDRQLTLIAATGYGRPEDVMQAKAAGFDDHLVKPVDLNRLSAVIQASGKAVSHASEDGGAHSTI
jgi:CheY-like chemotaxis protein/two-component sensor histidine kinase